MITAFLNLIFTRTGYQQYKTDKYFNYCKKMPNYVFETE